MAVQENQFPDFIPIVDWKEKTQEGVTILAPLRKADDGSLEECVIKTGDFVKLKNEQGYHNEVS